MARIAFRLWVKPDQLDEYIEHHRDVWPDLLRDMRDAGYRNYSIFADGPELFGYLECDDWDAAQAAMAKSDANRRWQAWMTNFLATPIDPDSTDSVRQMEEVFRLD
ncbi:MAG: L-rhamnose mutarotase [Thermomicrobiales bacterium]